MIQFFKQLSLFSFFGLMITLICWITLAEHSANYPVAAWLIIALVPLLFPLRGLLHGKPYTHAWTGFLMLFYFSHGIGEAYSAQAFDIYASLEVLFSFMTFSASIIFIRLNARQLKQLTKS
ncbi:hypothetical protein LCGC14_0519770 [marine sediment metagenome]|uniref:Uncharacterized protein n=1 Tax=marine sediment metagenome TaxID=412755 RepID=A0A0F9RYW9_9ZZZZ|nr:DUF2069 domain-containing protein [Methylophaga sp.]HEC60210.1 DUF2069 domain-containing protein [Methylophaga sp.]